MVVLNYPIRKSHKLLILDLDKTIRIPPPGQRYIHGKNFELMQIIVGTFEAMKVYKDDGYNIVGVGNQNDIPGRKTIYEALEEQAWTLKLCEPYGMSHIFFCPSDITPICYHVRLYEPQCPEFVFHRDTSRNFRVPQPGCLELAKDMFLDASDPAREPKLLFIGSEPADAGAAYDAGFYFMTGDPWRRDPHRFL